MTPTKTEIRADLERLPERLKSLPIDARGYPVPWFVAWIDGPSGEKIPEFRAMDGEKFRRAIREKRCWVCGDRLGRHMAFLIGPMCGINRTTSEPPSHLECAQWSARNCPFMTKPQMVRREAGPGAAPELIEAAKENVAGFMIEHNPGASLLWVTDTYKPFPDGKGGWLLEVGDPERIEWYAEGRRATRAQVEAAVAKGIPRLREVAEKDGYSAMREVEARLRKLEALYPES